MKKTTPFYVSLCFSVFTLLLSVARIIYLKSNDYLIFFNDLIFRFIGIAFALSMVFVLVKKIPGAVKVIFTLLIFLGTAFSSMWLTGVGGNTYFKVYNGIEEIAEYNAELPPEDDRYYFEKEIEIDSYGVFEDIACYRYLSTGVFQQRSFITIVKYSQEHFENEVKIINTARVFYEETLQEEDPVPVFNYDGFDFRLENNDSCYYPKHMDFIGINEETKEIAYVCFEDTDLDSVWSFKDLMNGYAGWYLISEERVNVK